MKKIVSLFLAVMLALFCVACSKDEDTAEEKQPKHHDVITEAITELKAYWREMYKKDDSIETDGHFEIKNTRVITIKKNDIDLFRDVKYIIEFELYTDYLGSAPYYENWGAYNNVIVYQDGTMEVATSYIRAYRSKTYQTDYSDFIKSIDDYEGQYNCKKKLK